MFDVSDNLILFLSRIPSELKCHTSVWNRWPGRDWWHVQVNSGYRALRRRGSAVSPGPYIKYINKRTSGIAQLAFSLRWGLAFDALTKLLSKKTSKKYMCTRRYEYEYEFFSCIAPVAEKRYIPDGGFGLFRWSDDADIHNHWFNSYLRLQGGTICYSASLFDIRTTT